VPKRDADYARKHWSGLIADYYAPRAQLLLEQVRLSTVHVVCGLRCVPCSVLWHHTLLLLTLPLQARGDAALHLPLNLTSVDRAAAALAYNFTTPPYRTYPVAPQPGAISASTAMRSKYASYFEACDQAAISGGAIVTAV
jgi:hypothetical protein